MLLGGFPKAVEALLFAQITLNAQAPLAPAARRFSEAQTGSAFRELQGKVLDVLVGLFQPACCCSECFWYWFQLVRN
jgi:hypothetical protein